MYATAVFAYTLVESRVHVAYTGSGSGAGRTQLLAGNVHWAGTDASFSDAEIQEHPDIRLFPSVAGSVVPVVNVALAFRSTYTGTDPAPNSGLVLGRETVAKIFAGSVTQWDDAVIQADNPHLVLPSTAITVVTRLDNSGTTELFTGALSLFSAEFAGLVGETSRTDRWPTSRYVAHIQASGNSGVAATVKLTTNAIGYAVLEAASSAESQVARMRNRAGVVVEASSAATSFAMMELGGSRNATTGTASLADAFSSAAWPICGFSYVAVSSTHMRGTCGERSATVAFLRWLLTSETVRIAASKLGFATLPDFLRDGIVAELTAFVECAPGVRAVSSLSSSTVFVGVPAQIANSWTILQAAYTASSTASATDGSVARFELQSSANHLYGISEAVAGLDLPSASPQHLDAAVHADPAKTPQDFSSISVAVRAARTDPSLSELGITYAASPNLVTVPFTLLALGVGANLPGVQAAAEAAGLPTEIRLTTTALGQIFRGTITSWSDTAILNANSHSTALQAALAAAGSITLALPASDDSIIGAFTWALSSSDAAVLADLVAAVPSGAATVVAAEPGRYISLSRYPTSGTVRTVDGLPGVEAALRVVPGTIGVMPAESLHGITITIASSDGSILRPVSEDTSACLDIRHTSVAAKSSCWPLTVPLYMSVRRTFASARLLRSLLADSDSSSLPSPPHLAVVVAPRALPVGSMSDMQSLRRGLQASLLDEHSNLTAACQRVRLGLLAATWLVGNDASTSALQQLQMEPLRGDSARGAQYALSEGVRCGNEAVLSLRAQCEVGEDRVSDITCAQCPRGTTNTVAGTECEVCPEEAVCAGGAHFAVATDYWEGANRKIYRCNLFACCTDGNCTLDSPARCAHGRVGNLCGWCPEGQSLASQAGGCVNCTDVNWGSLATTVLIQLLFVAYLIYSARDDVKNAAVLLVVEFFQLAQLAMNPYREELSFSLELGWLNLRLNPPGSVDCVFPMTPLAFLASPLYVPLFISFVLFVYTALFTIGRVCTRCKFDVDANTLWRFQQAGWGTLFVVLAATVQVGLEIMTCREVEGVMVNAALPAVQCSGVSYYVLAVVAGAAAIGFLAVVPFAVYSSNGHYLALLSKYKSAFRILSAVKAITHIQERVRLRQDAYRLDRGLPPLPRKAKKAPRDTSKPPKTSVRFTRPAVWGPDPKCDGVAGRGGRPDPAVTTGFETMLGGALATIGLGDLVKPKPRVHYDLESIGWSTLPLVVRGNAPLFRPYAGAMAQSFHAFFLLRRSISVVITTFLVSDPHAKQIFLLFWLLTALLVSLATKPFRDFLDNVLNTFSLSVLCLIAALELHYISFINDRPERVSFIQIVLIFLFILCVPFVFVSRYLLNRRKEAVHKAVKEGTDIPPQPTTCVARTHTRTVSFCRRVCANNMQSHSIFDDSQYDSDDVTELRRKQLLYARMRERDRLAAEKQRMRAAGIATINDAPTPAAAAAAASATGHAALASRSGAVNMPHAVRW